MKLYDCFLFDNELDMLELRFRELHDIVDIFVVVESSRTFQGKPKPQTFRENVSRFDEWAQKIERVSTGSGFPAPFPERGYDFSMQKWQLNSMLSALIGSAEPEDLILISDVDEIPNRTVLHECRDGMYAKQCQAGRFHLEMAFHRFYFECRVARPAPWYGAAIVPYWLLRQHSSPAKERFEFKDTSPRLPNAGWHFSFFGGVDEILHKMESNSDSNQNHPSFRDRERIKQAILKPESPFGRKDVEMRLMEPGKLPRAVGEEPEKYKHWFREGLA